MHAVKARPGAQHPNLNQQACCGASLHGIHEDKLDVSDAFNTYIYIRPPCLQGKGVLEYFVVFQKLVDLAE